MALTPIARLPKRLVQTVLGSLGYEIRRKGSMLDSQPDWIPVTDSFEESQRMANRAYRPPRVQYELVPRGGDVRVKYLLYFMDFRDLRVLELGPYVGQHSVMLEKMGVRETISLESRRENFEECLQTKQRYALERTTFHLADVEALAVGRQEPPFQGVFDVVLCAGLLYHLTNPAETLEWCRRQAPTLFLQTHYVEEAALERFWPDVFTDTVYRHDGYDYRAKLFHEDRTSARSGLSASSVWLHEADLLQMLERAGFGHVSVLGKDVDATYPHITILAAA